MQQLIQIAQQILALLLGRDGIQTRRLIAFQSNYMQVTQEPQRLPDTPCDAVLLSVWNTQQDNSYTFQLEDANNSYNEANLEIYWGIGGVPAHQLFPKETTQYIYTNNLRNISANCSTKKADPTRQQFIGYTVFKYMTEEEIKRRGL